MKKYICYRQRLKELFISNLSHDSFSDSELLQLLVPAFYDGEEDTDQIVQQLLSQFGNLGNLVNADKEELFLIDGINENIFVVLRVVRELIKRVLKQKLVDKNIIQSLDSLIEYLQYSMGNLKTEHLRVLYLNKKNILITEEIMSVGTIDQIHIYPRNIVRSALLNHASAVILVHNHPSGNVKPSSSDISLTKNLVQTCKSLNIKLHDHIIISSHGYFSFKCAKLLN